VASLVWSLLIFSGALLVLVPEEGGRWWAGDLRAIGRWWRRRRTDAKAGGGGAGDEHVAAGEAEPGARALADVEAGCAAPGGGAGGSGAVGWAGGPSGGDGKAGRRASDYTVPEEA